MIGLLMRAELNPDSFKSIFENRISTLENGMFIARKSASAFKSSVHCNRNMIYTSEKELRDETENSPPGSADLQEPEPGRRGRR
jgi:hypothetical protein